MNNQTNYDDVKRRLKREGYTKVVLVASKPKFKTKPHFHLKELKIVVVRGSLKATVGNKTKIYLKGDFVIVPKRTMHSGIAGNKGLDAIEGVR